MMSHHGSASSASKVGAQHHDVDRKLSTTSAKVITDHAGSRGKRPARALPPAFSAISGRRRRKHE